MDARSIHLQDIGAAINYLKMVMADVSQEQAQWVPPGTVQTIAATYAHILLSTDWQYHKLFKGLPALYESEWAGRTGISAITPAQTLEWGKSVQVDLGQARLYGEAVLAGLVAFAAAEDLERSIDMSGIGAGTQSLSWCLSMVVSGHLFVLIGEIAALKGIQGLKGDAF